MVLRLKNIDLKEVHVTFKGNREVSGDWEEKKFSHTPVQNLMGSKDGKLNFLR